MSDVSEEQKTSLLGSESPNSSGGEAPLPLQDQGEPVPDQVFDAGLTDDDEHEIDDSGLHLVAALEHLAKFWHGNERERKRSIKKKIAAARRRAADLEQALQTLTHVKEQKDILYENACTERDGLRELVHNLNTTQATNADTLSRLQSELSTATRAAEVVRGEREEETRRHNETVAQLKTSLGTATARSAELQEKLQTEQGTVQQLQAEQQTLTTRLQAAQDTNLEQQGKLKDFESRTAEQDTELTRLRALVQYNQAIVQVWKEMPVTGKLQAVRGMLPPEHPYYNDLERAPELIELCARRTDLQQWLKEQRFRFQGALKAFPLQPVASPNAAEVIVAEALREFQTEVNNLLMDAGIEIISPRPGDKIDPERHKLAEGFAGMESHSQIVGRCLQNGYWFDGILLPAIIQPALDAAEGDVETPEAENTAPKSDGDTLDGNSLPEWYTPLVMVSRRYRADSRLQIVMKAFDRLIEVAPQSAQEDFDYGSLTPEFATVAPLFTSNVRHQLPYDWLTRWVQAWERAEGWLDTDLGIVSFAPKDDSLYDPETMDWASTPFERNLDRSQRIRHTSLVGFRVRETGETVLKATVTTPAGGN